MLKNVANTDKHLCCSCGICEGVCNQGAITMKENVEGFYVPEIDMNKCNNCGLCYAVCPGDKINDKQIYSSMNQAVPKDYLIGNVKEWNHQHVDRSCAGKCGQCCDFWDRILGCEITAEPVSYNSPGKNRR